MALMFLMMKVVECLRVIKDVDLSLNIPATLPFAILELIVALIKLVTMEEVDIGLNRPSTLLLAIMQQVLMLKIEVDIGLISDTLPTA